MRLLPNTLRIAPLAETEGRHIERGVVSSPERARHGQVRFTSSSRPPVRASTRSSTRLASGRRRATLAAILCLLALTVESRAAELVVTSVEDDGPGSLRAAIAAAVATAEPDTILIHPVLEGRDIILTSGSLVVSRGALFIDGSLASGVSIDGNARGRVLEVGPLATVELIGLTLRNGDAALEPTGFGGGIFNAGKLVVTSSIITQNRARIGGGIYNAGGELTVVNSSITDNRGGVSWIGGGGGIANDSGRVRLDSSTVSGNATGPGELGRGLPGGGLMNFGSPGGTLELINSTVSSNTASHAGGGLYNDGGAVATLHGVTLTSNHALEGGGIDNFGTMEAQSSILAGNLTDGGTECKSGAAASLLSRGFNLLGADCEAIIDPSTDLVLGSGDLIGLTIEDVLDTNLSANGGLTASHALRGAGPAIDSGTCAFGHRDQRGLERPVDVPSSANADDGCDIGAVELDNQTCISIRSGDWDDPSMWTCLTSPPGINDDVLVAAGHKVTIKRDEEVRTLEIAKASACGDETSGKGGAILAKSTDESLLVTGHLRIDGGLRPTLGTFQFRGDRRQMIEGCGDKRFHRLSIESQAASPDDEVEAFGSVIVEEKLQVQNGQFRPDDGSDFADVEIGTNGALKPKTGSDIRVSGDWTHQAGGEYDANGGKLIFAGPDAQSVTGPSVFDNLVVDKPTPSETNAVQLSSQTTVRATTQVVKGDLTTGDGTKVHDLRIKSGGTVKSELGSRLHVTGSLVNEGGRFEANGGTISMEGDGPQVVTGGLELHNLELDKPIPDDELNDVKLGDGTTVEGKTHLKSGYLETGDGTKVRDVRIEATGALKSRAGARLRVTGNLTNGGGKFEANGGTVAMEGDGPQAVTGKVELYNLEVDKPAPTELNDVELGPETRVVAEARVARGRLTTRNGAKVHDVRIEADGKVTSAPGSKLHVTGSLVNDGGRFEANGGTISMEGDGPQVVTGGLELHNLELNKPTPDELNDVKLGDRTTVEGTTDVKSGYLETGNGTKVHDVGIEPNGTVKSRVGARLRVTGNLTNEGGQFEANGGTVSMEGDDPQAVSGKVELHNLDVDKSAPTELNDVELGPETRVVAEAWVAKGGLRTRNGTKVHDVRIEADGKVTSAPGSKLHVTGSLVNDGGRFEANGGTISMEGDGPQVVTGGLELHNLELNKPSGNELNDVKLGDRTTVEGTTDVKSGYLETGNGTKVHNLDIEANGTVTSRAGARLSVTGNLTNEGGRFEANDGTVAMEGDGPQVVAGGFELNDLMIVKSTPDDDLNDVKLGPGTIVRSTTDIWQGKLRADDGTELRDLKVRERGSFATRNGSNVRVSGNVVREGAGKFEASGGTVTFNGAGPQAIAGGLVFGAIDVVKATSDDEVNKVELGAGTEVKSMTDVTDGKAQAGDGTELKDVTIRDGASFKSEAGASILVKGDLEAESSGEFEANGGTVVFDGAGKQLVRGPFTFYEVEVFKTTPDDDVNYVELGAEAEITSSTDVKKGRLEAGDGAELEDVVIRNEGKLSSKAGSTFRVGGDFSKETAGTFDANGGTVVFDGNEKQTIGGTLVFHNVTVDKTTVDDDQNDLELIGSTSVENDTLVVQGQLQAGSGTTLEHVKLYSTGRVKLKPDSQVDVKGDVEKEKTAAFLANGGRVRLSGEDPVPQKMTLAGVTTMDVNLVNPLGVSIWQIPDDGGGTSRILACDKLVVFDEVESGDQALVKCGSITVAVTTGPLTLLLGTDEATGVTIPGGATVTADDVEGEFSISNSPESTESITITHDGAVISLPPGNQVTTTPESALLLLIRNVQALSLSHGLERSLVDKLEEAVQKLTDINPFNDGAAVGSINEFIDQVEAQRDRKIESQAADELIDLAEQILVLIANG